MKSVPLDAVKVPARVLLVEDEQAFARYLGRLPTAGYAVTLAHDGAEAVKVMEALFDRRLP